MTHVKINILVKNKNPSLLNETFLEAVKCGDSVHNQTQLSSERFSISRVAVKNAVNLRPNIRIQKIIIIGSGETAELTARHFINSGAQHITISNRTEKKGRKLAKHLNANYVAIDELMGMLKDLDIIVTATSSMQHLIKSSDVQSILSDHSQKEILFIDISRPRNVDPTVQNINGITLIDIESLKGTGMEISSEQKGSIALAEKLVQQYVIRHYENWYPQSAFDMTSMDSQSVLLDS